jgi:hypothetical protein
MQRLTFALVSLLAALPVVATSCETYVAPPRASIVGLSSGVLIDPRAPLVIDFGTPIDPSSLSVKVVLLETDAEGNLRDEDGVPATELHVLVRHDPIEGDAGARAELTPSGTRVWLILDKALPVGPQLALLVEGGVRSTSGRVAKHRQRLPFSYVVQCAAGASSFVRGTYFVLFDVEEPLPTQIQMLAFIDVDPSSGALRSQFTNADRNPALQCPGGCAATDVCRYLPAPACVAPSTPAGTVDEYPDFVPNPTPPIGYSFLVEGCAVDDGTGSGVLTAPATLIVESPQVTAFGLTLTAQFAPSADGTIRATGSLVADDVHLGRSALGPGKGSMTAVRIPDDRAPPGVPLPPPRAVDAGTRTAR